MTLFGFAVPGVLLVFALNVVSPLLEFVVMAADLLLSFFKATCQLVFDALSLAGEVLGLIGELRLAKEVDGFREVPEASFMPLRLPAEFLGMPLDLLVLPP